jgi:LPS sulfotransferase NodH
VHVEPRRVATVPVRIVVLTVPRSGSTALCHLLGQCDGAEMHFELFHATEIQYRTGAVTDARMLEARDAQPVAFMEGIFAEAEGRGASLVGFKFFAFHKKRVLRRIVEDETIKIVCLTRSNALAQYSSRRIAEATGQWELAPGDLPEQRHIAFDPADFETFEATMHDWASLIGLHLAEGGRQALFVEYKTMLSDAGIARLSDFLGIPLSRDRGVPIVRQNPTRTIDRFSNPDVVRRYLDLRHKASWAYGG